nr:retrovirus-related Pol polyprotein from transposon TNT 1-94 [Tanacetum cinerariifolium]
MSFIRMVENQNDVKAKQIKIDNGTEFRNHKLESFCDEKGISQNFTFPYTREQNCVAERKNNTFIEAARTMLNGSDHLGKFDARADDGYFLRYSFISKAFRVFNTRRQQIEETYHVTFDKSMEAIRFTHTSEDEIGIDDSSRYPLDEFINKNDPSRQYQIDSDISYYVIPHGHSLSKLTQENQVPEVIAPNKPDIPHTKDTEGLPDLTNAEGTYEKNVQNDQMITQPTDSHILNHASTSSHPMPHDRWSRDQHIELMNIIGDPKEGMLTKSMVAKRTAASASECLFADFLSEIEPKKVSEALRHPGWVDFMQEELDQFYKNKVWTLVPLPYGKTTIRSKWVFRNKKDEHGITIKNKARLVAQDYSQEEGIDFNETFAPVARMEAIRIFIAFATYMNFKVYQMDVKSAFLNDKLKEEVYFKRPPGFKSSEFPNYVCKLDKALYGLKQAPRACSSVKIPMVPPNNLPVNETSYKEMIRNKDGRRFEDFLERESSLVKTPMVHPNNLRPDLTAEAEYVADAGCCANILWMKSQLSDYDIHYKMMPIFYDNTCAIALSNNLVLHSKTKHIDIRYHFIRDHINMVEYIRLKENKARRRVLNDALTSEVALSCEPTVSPLSDKKIDFRISFGESDDEHYTVINDKNSFSYKIISVNNLKANSENNNDKVDMPSFLSPEPTVSYFDDLDFFKDFENEPIEIPHRLDEFDLKYETSLFECEEEEQNVLYFNDLYPFNIIYLDDSKLDKDNDDHEIDIKQSLRGDVINTDDGAYAQRSNKLLETSHDTSNKFFKN